MNFTPTDSNLLLIAINQAQESYIADTEPELIFQDLLNDFLELSGSEFGFVGRVVRHNENLFQIKCQASNIPFEKDANTYFTSLEKNSGPSPDDFKNLLYSLIRTSEPVLFSSAVDQPEPLNCVSISASLTSLMAIPLSSKGHLFGVICLLNRPGGFSPDWIDYLQPLSETYLKLSQALESDRLLVKMFAESQKQQELRFHSLFQLSPDAILIATLDEYLDCNQTALKMFGLQSPTELRRLKLGELSSEEQPDGRTFHGMIELVYQECKQQGTFKSDWMFRRRNSDIFPAEVAIGVVPSLDGPDRFQWVIRDQSHTKEQEKRLQQHNKQRQEILDASPAGIIIVKFATGRVIFVNRTAYEMFGVEQGTLDSINTLQYWVDQDERKYFKDGLLKYGKVKGEVRFVNPQGEILTCMLYWQWNPGTSDEVLAWLVDISHIKAIENSLVRQQALQKIILDQLPVALFVKEIANDFRYSICNQMFSEIYSPQAHKWIGKTDFEIHSQERAEELRQQDLLAVNSNYPLVSVEELLGRTDSESILVSTRKICIPDENGNPMLLLGISEDITERREAERALQASERRFRELAEHAPVGIFLTDVNGACLFVNKPWQKMTGLNQEEAAGYGWLNAICEEDLPAVSTMWDDFVNDPSLYEMDYRFTRKNGEITWVSASAVPFRNESGQALGFLGACTDITQAKRIAVDLAVSRDEAHRANQAKSEFLSRMSHELRTPLNAILGFGQLLQLSSKNLTSSQNQGVSHILDAGELLLHLIEDILDLSRIDTGHVSLKIQATKIAQIFENSVALVHSMAQRAGVSIQQIRGDASYVVADPRRLQQVLVNLLTNAVKYNQSGGQVVLSAQRCNGRRVRLTVEDNGSGIHPSDQLRIWEPFERFHNPDAATEGSGIGLSICKNLVELMGGSIGFSSELNAGSSFWIELPHSIPDSGFDNQLSGELVQQISILKGLRIAYVEDDVASISLMSETICRLESCELQTAYNGVDGVALIKSTLPDLVLMDLNLPGIDGWEALAQLKNDERTRNIPVFALSASTSNTTLERAQKAGFVSFLPKPIRLKELFEALLTVVRKDTD